MQELKDSFTFLCKGKKVKVEKLGEVYCARDTKRAVPLTIIEGKVYLMKERSLPIEDREVLGVLGKDCYETVKDER